MQINEEISAVGIAWDAAFGETALLLDADSDMVYALAEGLAQGLVKNKALMDELEQYRE